MQKGELCRYLLISPLVIVYNKLTDIYSMHETEQSGMDHRGYTGLLERYNEVDKVGFD